MYAELSINKPGISTNWNLKSLRSWNVAGDASWFSQTRQNEISGHILSKHGECSCFLVFYLSGRLVLEMLISLWKSFFPFDQCIPRRWCNFYAIRCCIDLRFTTFFICLHNFFYLPTVYISPTPPDTSTLSLIALSNDVLYPIPTRGTIYLKNIK